MKLPDCTLAFASGKGGTGKTSLAVNYACHMATQQRVVLADLDVEEPNIGMYLTKGRSQMNTESVVMDLPVIDATRCTLCGKCADACNFNALVVSVDRVFVFKEMCKSCGRCIHNCDFDALQYEKHPIGVVNTYKCDALAVYEGCLDTGDIHTKSVIQEVKKRMPDTLAILDCPPGTTCPMVEAIGDADFVVLVTEPTPFGLHDLSLAVEVAEKLGKKFGIIINKSDDNDVLIENYCRENGYIVLGKIPFSTAIAQKCGNGELYYNDPVYSTVLENITMTIKEVVS